MYKTVFTLLTLSVFLIPAVAVRGKIYVVKPDGPGDFPTIQAAIDASSKGDDILLTDGVFKGTGNRDVDFKGKAVTVRSQSGRAGDCIIDPEGVPWLPSRGFDFTSMVWHDSVVRDITIINGVTDDC